MKYYDKNSSSSQPETYTTGELTHRFDSVASPEELEIMHTAIESLVVTILKNHLGEKEAQAVHDYMVAPAYGHGRLTLAFDEAERFAWILRQASGTLAGESESAATNAVATSIEHESAQRKLHADLDSATIEDFM